MSERDRLASIHKKQYPDATPFRSYQLGWNACEKHKREEFYSQGFNAAIEHLKDLEKKAEAVIEAFEKLKKNIVNVDSSAIKVVEKALTEYRGKDEN